MKKIVVKATTTVRRTGNSIISISYLFSPFVPPAKRLEAQQRLEAQMRIWLQSPYYHSFLIRCDVMIHHTDAICK